MATSDGTLNGFEGNFNGFEEKVPENPKASGRRRSKFTESTQKKKQPQRGMGVAQLERLRIQERWKKMTEIDPLHSLNLQNYQFTPSSFPDPGVPMQYGKFGATYGSGMNPALLLQRLGSGGFHGPVVSPPGVKPVLSDQFRVDPYGFGASNSNFNVGSVIETSKELSSIPNMKCYSEYCCGVCHKKKRINGENRGCNGERNMYAEMSPINGSNTFMGFNAGNKRNINGGKQNSGPKATTYSGYAGHNTQQEAEVVAVHRKGSSVGGSVLMEYEFFRGNGGRSTSYEEFIKLGPESSSGGAVGGEASCVTATTTTAGIDASTSIDLSLKLSY